MTREAPPKLLVVSSWDDHEELLATLRERGFDEIPTADGGDETLGMVRELEPDVVVLCAGTEKGDARLLAAALRREPRPPAIVLVGQQTGPVRNALDAAAYDVDQFVGRPLSAKALGYAVTRCAGAAAARAPQGDDPIDRATDVAIDDVVREAMESLPAPVEPGHEEVTAPARWPRPAPTR